MDQTKNDKFKIIFSFKYVEKILLFTEVVDASRIKVWQDYDKDAVTLSFRDKEMTTSLLLLAVIICIRLGSLLHSHFLPIFSPENLSEKWHTRKELLTEDKLLLQFSLAYILKLCSKASYLTSLDYTY